MTDKDQAVIQVQRLMELMQNIGIIHPSQVMFPNATISVGVATTHLILMTAYQSLSQSRSCFVCGKNNGRNQYHVATSENVFLSL